MLDAEGRSRSTPSQSIHCAITAVGAFFVAFAFGAAWSVVELLSNPFAAEIDTYNVDPLLASSERCLFVQLRSAIIGRELLSRAARESPVASAGADDLAEGLGDLCPLRRLAAEVVGGARLTETIGAAVARARRRAARAIAGAPSCSASRTASARPPTVLAATAPAGSEVVKVNLG